MSPGEGQTVLIVEDQRLIAADLENTLRKLGYVVIGVAPSGEEAIEKIAASSPELVLMDIRLRGELDGIQTAVIVRERFGTPVIYLTAYADEETILRAKATAPFGFIVKPFNERELRAAIEVALYRKEMDRILAAEREGRREADELKLVALEQFQALVEQAPDGIFIADLGGRYTDVNNAGCHMLGYTREELIGKSFGELIPPGDLERLWKVKERLLRGEVQVAEWALRRKDGTYLPVEVSAKILRDGRWQSFVRDISERKALEEERSRYQQRLDGIVSISVDAIISLDAEQRIIIYNAGAEQIFGWSREEVLGKPLDLLIPERLRETHRQHVRAFASEGAEARRMGERSSTIRGLRKSGEEFPAEAAISKVQIGGSFMFNVVLRDISERKRTEDDQRFLAEVGKVLMSAAADYESTLTELARLVVREMADWCIVDVLEDRQIGRLRVVHWDPTMAPICGELERLQLDRGRPHLMSAVLESQSPMLMSEVAPGHLESIAQSPEHLRLLRILDPKSLMAVPLIARGQILGALALLSSRPARGYDARDLHLVEELASSAALAVDNALLYNTAQRAIRARDDVLGIAAHDLRTPLNVIVMRSQTMLQGGEDQHHIQEAVGGITRAAQRMSRLIQDMLDVARLDSGPLAIQRDRVAPRRVIEDAVDTHRMAAASSSIELRMDITDSLPDVLADPDRLLQVFDNLISNAIKFTTANARITVGAAPREGDVLFRVADSGSGIPPEDLPHIFDRFWQAGKADRRGIGLGLAIVKGIVEAHGGRIWVESQVGVGTTFYFTVPAARSAEAQLSSPKLPA